MLRKEFDAPAKAAPRHGLRRRAWDFPSCTLNGRKVGDHVLSPGLTDYDKHVLYVTYDVTREMQPGRNAVGLMLGNGRYWAPRASSPIGMRSLGYPRAICQIELEYADGRKEVIATDATWKLNARGAHPRQQRIRRRDLRCAPRDDRLVQGRLRRFPLGTRATGQRRPTGALVAQMAEPLRVVTTLHPVKVTETPPRRLHLRHGPEHGGLVPAEGDGPGRHTVSLRHAETLTPDGSLYLDNLRTARALDYYTLKGAGAEVWEPRFTYHGFRYVEVRGYPGKPPLDAIEGRVVHDDMRLIADFKSSNELLNQLHHNILWGVRSNYRSIPTDCPQRDERQGWLGDRSMVSRSESYLFDIAAFYTKWHRDLEDSQRATGRFRTFRPTTGSSTTTTSPGPAPSCSFPACSTSSTATAA